MEIEYLVFKLSPHTWDMSSLRYAGPFVTEQEALDWIRDYAPASSPDEYYVVLPAYKKLYNFQTT